MRNLKIYIFGAAGFLGSKCAEYFRSLGYTVLDQRVDITDRNALRVAFNSSRPDVAINLTGPPVYPTIDWCEDNQAQSVDMLVLAPIAFTLTALEFGIYPIQITSGCVYTGGPEHEFTEEDAPNFFGSLYSRLRIAGQIALADLPVLQARIRMPCSVTSHPRNFFDKIISYKKLISIPNSLTLVEDLWPALDKLIALRPTGILNLTNEGYVEHYQILEAYKKYINPDHTYEPISLEQLQGPGGITKAKRSNCVLSVKKAQNMGINMPAINNERLKEIMEKYKLSLKNFS